VEGLAIYYAVNGQGYLLASSQGQSYFSVFERDGDNAFVRKFYVTGVGDTDGIDVLNVSLNDTFSFGIFACHNGNVLPYTVNLVKWEDIAVDKSPDLLIDTAYWNPREAILTEIGQSYYNNKIDCSVYPNPFTDYTTVKLSDDVNTLKIEIIDMYGRTVRTYDDFNSNSVTIHRENLPSGIYFIRIYSDDTYVKKVIIK
jgi:hypothetical protein